MELHALEHHRRCGACRRVRCRRSAETILIEHPIAVTSGSSGAARAFVEYVRSRDAQRVFAA
jgi:accessory colonization factor AcfC